MAAETAQEMALRHVTQDIQMALHDAPDLVHITDISVETWEAMANGAISAMKQIRAREFELEAEETRKETQWRVENGYT